MCFVVVAVVVVVVLFFVCLFVFCYCYSDIDECSPNQCLNGGSCTDQQNGFTCVCAAGFSGNLCEIGII